MRRISFPRYTVRLRLTLLYGGVFLLCGTILLGITYLLARDTNRNGTYTVNASPSKVSVQGPHGPVALGIFHVQQNGSVTGGRITQTASGAAGGSDQALPELGAEVSAPVGAAQLLYRSGAGGKTLPLPKGPLQKTIEQAESQAKQLQQIATQQHNDELSSLLVDLGIALGIVAVASMGLGWFVAGRALRPLQTITKAARAISASNLHERLSLSGPRDELHELGDTFDDLLERLERSFEAQRQFVANASHELRTPLTLERATLEVALADRDASAQDLRETCERVLGISAQQERLIDALLTLARSDRGLDHRDVLDLKAPVEEVLGRSEAAIAEAGLTVEASLGSALTMGDRRLVERLAANLVDNAVGHNVPGGWLRVSTRIRGSEALLVVENGGPAIAADEVERLFEPFRRHGVERGAQHDGHGLGLSIVAAIARAHDASVQARARPDGGLEIEVRFPPARGAVGGAPVEGGQAPPGAEALPAAR